MKNKLLLFVLLLLTNFNFAQQKGSFWKTTSKNNILVEKSSLKLPQKNLFVLDIIALKMQLSNSPQRSLISNTSTIILALPNGDGEMDNFKVFENSNMDPALAARYPEIKSYIGFGIDNPTLTAFISISPLGFKSMVLGPDKSAVFIEPFSQDLTTYSIYRKADKTASLDKFECKVIDVAAPQINSNVLRPNADDAILRTFRLAMSVTGEYTTYFGGTKALALAAINNTMTRVNGVFEKDFGARMILIANNDVLIYTNASTDPYSVATSMSNWNSELQNNLTNTIGNANYDIGHLFGASGGGGNAGCIGCICTNGSKGSGYTSPSDGIPSGDNFDVDYVAHELGHQFGGNHTFTTGNEGTGVHMEPGSGSTIMGYAGITNLDVQPHSDAYFHAISIQQITNNIKTKTCSVNTATGNSIPTANAGLDYTVPKSTPFMLTATATDANGDALTYNWEQMDSQTTTAAPSETKTTGVNFRSYNSTISPVRYFPNMTSVLTGATITSATALTVEALPSVARTMNFRVTVRDNRANGSANNSDDMVVTVNATAGPFSVSSPNTAVSYSGGSSQTITWAVAGTTANGVNCANVDILISNNAGATWTTLLAATPNDGTEAVIIPNTPGSTNRIMVKGTNHIFFDVSNTNFTITSGVADTVAPTAPTLSASGTTQTTTNLSWTAATDNVAVTGYNVYKAGVLLGSTTTTTTYAVTGLTASTAFAFTVKAKDAAGNLSVASNTVTVTTLAALDTTAPTAPTLSASGTTQTTTNLSWTAATDNVAVTGYNVYKAGVLLGSTTTTTTYAVTGLTASTAFAFTVKAKDAAGNLSVASNTVTVTTLAALDTTAPTAPTLSASGTTQTTTNLSWTAATDNVAVTGYNVYKAGVLLGSTTTTTTYAVTGLTASTAFAFTVKAKDAAGNLSVASNTVTVTTLAALDTTAPTAPTLSASGTTQTTTNLSWTAATDNVAVTGYNVYKAGVLLGSTTTTTTYAVTGLTASTAFAFTVKAKDAAGNLSVASNTVTVTTLAALDTTAPTAPTLSASGTTQTTTNLSWTAATDNVAVTGYNVYKAGVLLGSTTTTRTYAVTGLTASTAYAFTVKAKDAAGNLSVASNTVTVTTLAIGVNYCTSLGSITSDEKIGKVVFGTISNTSTGTAGYENFTALSTSVYRGVAYTITITPAWTSTIYSEGYAVFIDYNGNGLFTDAGETVWTKAKSKTTPVSGTFTIPATAILGPIRMRVSMKYNGIPTPCETIAYGQVEDYTINVTSTAKMETSITTNFISFDLYPNPVNGEILNISNLDKTSDYKIFNLMGQEFDQGKIENEGFINVGKLSMGTFLIQISNEYGITTKRFIKQ